MGSQGAVEVLNLGVNSWTFEHYATLADLNYLDLDPDYVLVGITLNDFARMENAKPAKRIDRHKTGFPKPVWFGRLQERLARTYAARFINELDTRYTYARMNSDELEEYHTKWMRTIVSSWADAENVRYFTGQLQRFRDTLLKQGVTYAFVLFPELNDLLHPDEFGQPRNTVRSILDANHLKYCDPYDKFSAAPDPASLFLPHDDVHYTAAGHALLCSAIIDCVAEKQLPSASAASGRTP
jgi:lysophospholipase L1-like esterase